jgi:hypothetical protein
MKLLLFRNKMKMDNKINLKVFKVFKAIQKFN